VVEAPKASVTTRTRPRWAVERRREQFGDLKAYVWVHQDEDPSRTRTCSPQSRKPFVKRHFAPMNQKLASVVRVTNLMPVRRLPFPFGPQSAGFVERLYLHALESHVGNLRADQTSTFFNGKILAVADACRHVAYGQAHGFLPPYVCIYRID
jgi:hypothetical protein